jgi:hypothetical protein
MRGGGHRGDAAAAPGKRQSSGGGSVGLNSATIFIALRVSGRLSIARATPLNRLVRSLPFSESFLPLADFLNQHRVLLFQPLKVSFSATTAPGHDPLPAVIFHQAVSNVLSILIELECK